MKYAFVLASLTAAMTAGCSGTPSQTASMAPGAIVDAVPGAALQGATLSGPVAVANGADSSSDDEVCKRLDPYTGSRVGGRMVCMTQAEWDERERVSREFATDAATNGKWNLDKSD